MHIVSYVEVFLISLLVGAFLCYAEAPVPCTALEFKCLNGECINRHFFCNGFKNCRDNSDEQFCEIDSSVLCPLGWIRCPGMRRCILPHWLCDGFEDCNYISEERNCDSLTCTPSIFKCMDGYCIPRPWFCDGKVDCQDRSDERYCDINPESLCLPGWIRCPNTNRCILSHWKCDGVTDCTGISEEISCGNNTSETPDNNAAKITDNSAALKQDTSTTKAELKSWILRQRKPGSGTDRWGPQVHRIAVALHLADNSTFGPGNNTGEEIRYEMTIQLLHRLAKDKRMSSQELALYININALLVACMDPTDFYGDDLVRELRRRVEVSGNYTNPFLILVLCNAGDTMTATDVERVTEAYNSQLRPFWTDSQASASMALSCISSRSGVSVDYRTLKDMLLGLKRSQSKNGTVGNIKTTALVTQASASMALSCISSRSGVSVDYRTLKDMLLGLKRSQSKNGTVGNIKTTALVTQALFIHESYQKGFDLNSAMRVLVDGLKGSKSLLDAYYALPAFHRKSLLNVTSGHCRKQPVAEEEALQKALYVIGETIAVQYSVWIGDEINLVRTWRLKMLINSTIYDAIETVAKIDNRQKVDYNVVDGKPYVSSLNGKEDDSEMGMFWFVYLKTQNSDENPKIVEESPVDVKLKLNQEIILWYKVGSWCDQNVIQKPAT